MNVRFASEADAPALLAIYEQYIHTSVTFETELPSPEDFRERIRSISQTYPYLVLEDNEKILGYAYAHRFRERAAYDWIVELSIYLDESCRGKGLGPKLYGLLMNILRLQGVKTAVGCVTCPNPRSEGMHTAMGFRLMGVSACAGYKNGRWHDVSWFEKALASYDVPPAPVTPIGKVSRALLAAAVREYDSGDQK